MSEGARPKRRSNAADRRPLRFWEPFNIWWRAELERTGKRANSEEIGRWYAAQAGHAWGPERPNLQETRTHAKCLRSVSSVRDYFREYRAKKKHEYTELDMEEEEEEEEEDDRRSRKNSSRRGRGSGGRKGSRAARSNSTAPVSDMSGAVQSYMPYSINEQQQGYWGSGHQEGTTSGATTGAAAGCGCGGGADSQTTQQQQQQALEYGGYGQHMHTSFDMACVHPGALEAASWAMYQQAAMSPGPVTTQDGPSTQAEAMQQYLLAGQLQQQHSHAAGGVGGDAANGEPAAGPSTGPRRGSSQQQSQQDVWGLGPIHTPAGSAAAAAGGRFSLNLLSPGLHQLASSSAFQMEIPAISPRVQQGLAAAVVGHTETGLFGTPGSSLMRQQGLAATSTAVNAGRGTTHARQQPPPVPLWGAAAQQYFGQHHQLDARMSQGFHSLSAAAGFGGFAAQPSAMRQAQQPDELGGAQPTADAPASAPQAAAHSHPGDAAKAAVGAGCADAADTPRGVIPASLLAALPLPLSMPGCPGHSTVDSILRQLEAGVRTPRGSLGPNAAVLGTGGHPFARMSLSALLDAPGLLPHGAAAASRQMSQSFEHLALPGHQRMSLYAMGSGMLDMLAEGLDLDSFLGASDLAAGGAGAGAGAAAAAGSNGDGAIPVAPGGRASLRWLRASYQMHVPEHWQQQLQALQETPFHGGMPAAAGAGPVVMPAPQAPFRMARASSAGMEALAEAAAAALAAQPKPQLGCSTAGPTPAQQPTGAGDPEVGACAEDGAGAVRPAPHKKRTREQRAAQAELGPQQQKPAASKRPCAGLGLYLEDQQDCAGTETQAQGFRYVLDLATPRPQPAAPQQAEEAQPPPAQQQEPPQQQQQEAQRGLHLEQRAEQEQAAAAPAAAALQQGTAEPQQKRPVVLDLRPEELGATSENTLATPQRSTAHPEQAAAPAPAQQPSPQAGAPHAEQEAAGGAVQAQWGPRRLEGLMLPPLQNPANAAAGISTAGSLHCGPATAASTTGAPPIGLNGAILPAPAMAHVAMAAAAAVRPHMHASAATAAAVAAAPRRNPSDPARHHLPGMDEIERMLNIGG